FRSVADALIATDTEGNIAFINPPAATLTGWEPEEAKGKPLAGVFQAFDEVTGLPVIGKVESLPAVFNLVHRAGGPAALVEARMSENRDDRGRLLGIIVVFRDITERRR